MKTKCRHRHTKEGPSFHGNQSTGYFSLRVGFLVRTQTERAGNGGRLRQ